MVQVLCPVSRGITGKKLVIVPGQHDGRIHLDRSYEGMVRDHVVKAEVSLYTAWPTDLHLDSKADRLVVILARLHQTESIPNNHRCLKAMADLLACHRRIRNSPQDIVLVNFTQLDDKDLFPTAHAKETFEALYRRADNEFQARGWRLGSRHEWRTPAELASVSTKFITMKEYLTEFDWDGVYTEDEVAELLKEEESRNG